jgi:hypothetical protein
VYEGARSQSRINNQYISKLRGTTKTRVKSDTINIIYAKSVDQREKKEYV